MTPLETIRSAIFDVDGTLTDTTSVDAECYVEAIESVFALEDVSGDWTDYADVTDSGILVELVQDALGRGPSASERREFVNEFLSLLQDAHSADSRRFAPIPGADTFFERLRERGWRIAIATGGWDKTARAKLEYAGVDISGIPIVSADDARSRAAILEKAISQLGLPPDNNKSPVVFGDAIWDVEAAKKLQLPLVGVGSGSQARELLEAGAVAVFQDFTDVAALDAIMENT